MQQRHTHLYERVSWGKNGTVIWKCQLVDCSHYLHVEFIIGKACICYKCGSEFTMTTPKLLRKRPKCDSCQHSSGQGPKKGEKRPISQKNRKPSIPDLSDINIDDLLENL